jgi:aspartate aminotransferase
MIDAFAERRDLILNLLSELKGFTTDTPDGAFYVFPDISAWFGKTVKGHQIENSTDFSLMLLEEANVATVSGDSFGTPECIRISYAANSEKITEAVRRIKEVLS